MRYTLTLEEAHHRRLPELTMPEGGHEHVAYVLCGRAGVAADPWDGRLQRRYQARGLPDRVSPPAASRGPRPA